MLEKAASEGKKGAGQYFTPRVLIQSIERVMKPDPRVHPEFIICDPACGSGGFLVCAYEWLMQITNDGAQIDRRHWQRIKKATYYGQDLVPRPRRLALMNLYLHGLEPTIYLGDSIYEPDAGNATTVCSPIRPLALKEQTRRLSGMILLWPPATSNSHKGPKTEHVWIF